MEPVEPVGANFTYKAPVGQEDEVGDLRVRCEPNPDDQEYVFSRWTFTDEEREAIGLGYDIELGLNTTMAIPPLSLTPVPPKEGFC